MSIPPLIIAFFIAIFFFAIVDYNQLRKMRTDHERLAELGAILITKYELTGKQERFIKSCLDDIFQWWFMPFAVAMLPVIVLRMLTNKKNNFPTVVSELSKYEEFKEFKQIHMNSLFSSNSFFALIFLFLSLLIVVPVFLFGGLKASLTVPQSAVYRASPRFKNKNSFV